MGIARTFQNIALFWGMTVLENILTGRNQLVKTNFLQQALYLGWTKREELDHRRSVEDIIDFLQIQSIQKMDQVIVFGWRRQRAVLACNFEVIEQAGALREEKVRLLREIGRVPFQPSVLLQSAQQRVSLRENSGQLQAFGLLCL